MLRFILVLGLACRCSAEYGYIKSVTWSDLCLSVLGGNMKSGAPVYQDKCEQGPHQLFEYIPQGDGFAIKIKHSQMCLSILKASVSLSAELVQLPCRNHPNQLFVENPTFHLRPIHSGLCLTGSNHDVSRAPIIQWKCVSKGAQLWEMIPLSPIGVNGDPLIMGLAGQIFRFEGHSGSWYSAVSAQSFQWNMKIQKFEGCAADNNDFVNGMGLTLFDNGKVAHQIEVNVVNPFSVNTGCGMDLHKPNDFECLGSGSLEIIVDGHKIVQSVDMPFKDNTGRIIAYNTIGSCSRRWFDFDVTKTHEPGSIRRLKKALNGTGMFDVLSSTKSTFVDKERCKSWIEERKLKNDMLMQAGSASTIVIKTEKISFHIEYKQQWERCKAHNIDVWITDVSDAISNENWEGLIGETKDLSYKAAIGEKPRYMTRQEALKFKEDSDYEVLSPFSTDCKACVARK